MVKSYGFWLLLCGILGSFTTYTLAVAIKLTLWFLFTYPSYNLELEGFVFFFQPADIDPIFFKEFKVGEIETLC